MKRAEEQNRTEKIVALAKRRGFVFQGSEIYGGLSGTWDYGPLGVLLKRNIMQSWWKRFVEMRDDMYGLDAAIMMNPRVWEASGHVEGFADPLVECKKCRMGFRADELENNTRCPECEGQLSIKRQFHVMFRTHIGASADETAAVYLRPETAQGIFVNFKNIIDAFHPKLPFGIAQMGKAFRNEISPRDFLFRSREFEQMEVEYFVRPEEWERHFDEWRKTIWDWLTKDLGLKKNHVDDPDVPEADRAHYSKRTIDFAFDYPFGRKELCGLAYRTDYDLSRHAQYSGADLSYYDEESGKRFVPHVIEPSLGVERVVFALLADAYAEEEAEEETRTVLRLRPLLAPVKAAVFPLLKNKPELVARARTIYAKLKMQIPDIMWDDNGNIGKRYRRQDEIGTPFCVTVDFDTLKDHTVTVRDRDTMQQERIEENALAGWISSQLSLGLDRG